MQRRALGGNRYAAWGSPYSTRGGAAAARGGSGDDAAIAPRRRLVVRSSLLATVERAGLTTKEIPSGAQPSRASSRTNPDGGGPFEARPQTTAALAVEATENRSVLVCGECGRTDDGEAAGWRGYREDLPDEDEQPSLAFFCSACAAREFDAAEQ